ncbi:hypothetical protein BCY91_05085 [Pelobium manganitolerans]|uniref:Uncharacterized protein n=1 Tax=Pelobium manganitolerans TaxID=1842495 RepID=A0A419S5W7_9SPHI|nr:hypothetical protein [Pelobium manganitolerans]RKD16250.1 hypothetical protein BCY91_05085 [Pelobium manganitolerans]
MIEDDTLNHIIHDFSTNADHETLIIPTEQRDNFWFWFQNKAEQYDLVYVDEKLVNEKFLAGRCYGNAQIVSVENDYEYAEGFAKATDRYILHGFNLRDISVVDVTAQNHVDSFEQYLGGLPECLCWC